MKAVYLNVRFSFPNSKFIILELLNFVFNIEKPLNTVYIIQETNNNKETLNNQLNRSEINENINIIKNFIKSENVKHKIIEV